MLSLIPKRIVPSVCDLTPEYLADEGVDVLLLDFDNTIVPYTCDEPTEAVLSWLRSVQRAGVTLCVVSNTRRRRAPAFCEKYGIPCITHAAKPFQRGIRKAKELYPHAKKIALAGDQIYTDVLGANTGGLLSVLVRPIHLHNFWLRLRHWAELPWIGIGLLLQKKRGKC